MSIFLNCIYIVIVILASPWLVWRIVMQGKNRRGWVQKLFGWVPRRASSAHCIWLHAVSVGEVNLLEQLISRLAVKFPGSEFVITTSTETGFDFARKKYESLPGCRVCFCPADFSWAVNNFLRRIRPEMLLIAELEIWPNLIRCSDRFGLAVCVVNGRLSEKSYSGYRRTKWLLSPVFRRLALVAVQNQEYAERFLALGCLPDRVKVTGSVKYDGVCTTASRDQTERLGRLLDRDGTFTFVAGSTQWEEDLVCLDVFEQLRKRFTNFRLVLVPRHLDRIARLKNEIKRRGFDAQLRSRLIDGETVRLEQNTILIIDVIGELAGWWGLADVGFVGGSLCDRGGQNMLEPAGSGVPICFGPNTWNFKHDVALLLAADAARVVNDQNELAAFISRCLKDRAFAHQLASNAQNLVIGRKGASARTIEAIAEAISPDERRSPPADSRAA